MATPDGDDWEAVENDEMTHPGFASNESSRLVPAPNSQVDTRPTVTGGINVCLIIPTTNPGNPF